MSTETTDWQAHCRENALVKFTTTQSNWSNSTFTLLKGTKFDQPVALHYRTDKPSQCLRWVMASVSTHTGLTLSPCEACFSQQECCHTATRAPSALRVSSGSWLALRFAATSSDLSGSFDKSEKCQCVSKKYDRPFFKGSNILSCHFPRSAGCVPKSIGNKCTSAWTEQTFHLISCDDITNKKLNLIWCIFALQMQRRLKL